MNVVLGHRKLNQYWAGPIQRFCCPSCISFDALVQNYISGLIFLSVSQTIVLPYRKLMRTHAFSCKHGRTHTVLLHYARTRACVSVHAYSTYICMALCIVNMKVWVKTISVCICSTKSNGKHTHDDSPTTSVVQLTHYSFQELLLGPSHTHTKETKETKQCMSIIWLLEICLGRNEFPMCMHECVHLMFMIELYVATACLCMYECVMFVDRPESCAVESSSSSGGGDDVKTRTRVAGWTGATTHTHTHTSFSPSRALSLFSHPPPLQPRTTRLLTQHAT